jgi:hypothetical protein
MVHDRDCNLPDQIELRSPQHTHEVEQEIAFLIEHAAVAGRYFDALLDQRFTRAEALRLTLDWQGQVLTYEGG